MSIIEQALLKRSKDSSEPSRKELHAAGESRFGQDQSGQPPFPELRRGRKPPGGGGSSGRSVQPIQAILKEKDMLVPGALNASLADEYRRIKKPLLGNAFGKGSALILRGNLVLVTSALPGEGKTYTTINLAVSMALEKEKTVLLVDCDTMKQDLSRIMGLKDAPGLADVLEQKVDLSDVLVHTDIPDLVLLPAGVKHDYVTEALSSDRMTALVGELATRYPDRMILFDSPPLLSTPQSVILAGLVGQAAIVVDAANTPQSSVQDALALLEEGLAIGLILNKAGSSRKRYSSAYYYGDSYGEAR